MRVLDIFKRWRPAVEEWSSFPRDPVHRRVDHQTPLTIPAAYQAIRMISQTLASLPLRVYQRQADGNRAERTDHPVARVLAVRPNDAMTPIVFRETVQAHCLGWGNGFARVRYNNRGDVRSVEPIHPVQVRLHPDYEVGEMPRYRVWLDGEAEIDVAGSEMLHLPALGSIGVWGYSPISLFRGAFEIATETEEYGRAFFRNDASPGGILVHPGVLKEDAIARLKEQWRQAHANGARNKHKVAVLEEGMKYEPISLNPEDAQFLQTRQFAVTDIARIYNVPPHMLGDLERATFSNIEHQAIEFVRYTLRPWAVRWEEELNRKLFPNRPDLFCEFDFDGLLRGDTQSRFNAYSQAIQDGWISRNEVRRKENLEPVEGLDSMLVPLNMGVAQDDGGVQDPQADEPTGEPVEADDEERSEMHRVVEVLRPCLEDPVGRVCRAAEDKRKRAAKSGRLDDWKSKHEDGFPGALRAAVERPASSVLRAAWPDAPDLADEALGARLTKIGSMATVADSPDQGWIVDMVESAIIDIVQEAQA